MTRVVQEVSPSQLLEKEKRNRQSHQNTHAICDSILVQTEGVNSVILDAIERELCYFNSAQVEPSLRLIFGEYPSPDWEPRGVSISEDLLYNDSSQETIVLGPLRPPPARKRDVKYVIVGDLRDSNQKVRVYIPRSNPKDLSRVRTLITSAYRKSLDWAYLGILARRSFLNNLSVERSAGDILCSILEPFLYHRLPSSGYSLAHGSSVSLQGCGALLIGSSNVGKTTLALELTRQGYAFLGDDLAIIDREANILAYPKRIKLEEKHPDAFPEMMESIRTELSRRDTIVFNRLLKSRPGTLFDYLPRPLITELIPGAQVERKCRLSTVFLMKRGTFGETTAREIDTSLVCSALANEIFWEFETQFWRHNQFAYCPSKAEGRDFLEEEYQHRSRVSAIMRSATAKVKAFELQLPPNFEIDKIGKLIEKYVLN